MSVFLKFIGRSMTEKKSQFILLLFAVILSSTLVVCSFGLTDVVKSTFTQTFTKTFENRDVNITATNKNGLIKLSDINLDGFNNLLPSIDLKGVYTADSLKNSVSISAREGIYIDKSKILEGDFDKNSFTSNKAIISKRTSDTKNLSLGDKIKINLNGMEEEFIISNIYASDGPFYSDDANFSIIVPYDYVSKKINIEGSYTTLIANSIDGNTKESSHAFNENNTDFKASELVNSEMIDMATSMITNVLMILSSIVIFLSVIIIFSSFKLIVTERIPIIGTFLSQGATKFKIGQILLLESFLYGLTGGIFAFLFGSGLIKVIAYYTSPLRDYKIVNEAPISLRYLFIALIFGISLSILSSILPILSIRKLPIKEVILGKYEASYKTNFIRFILGLLLFVIGSVLYFVYANKTISLLILLMSLVFMMKKIVELIASLLYLFFKDRASILAIAINNVKASKELMNSITIMLIAIISVTSITSISTSLIDVLTGAYNSLRYDIGVSVVSTPFNNTSNKVIDELLNDSRIDKDSIQIMGTLFGHTDKVGFPIMGIDTDKYRDLDGYLDWENEDMKKAFEALEAETTPAVLVTKNVNSILEAKVGDIITVQIGNQNVKLKVCGIIDGKLMVNGFFLMMKNSDIATNIGGNRFENICFNVSGDINTIKKDLAKSLEKYDVRIKTLDDDKNKGIENSQLMVNVLSIFSALSVIIAAFGLLNNMGISYLNSKKNLALLTSLGLNKGHKNRLLIYQGLIVVFFVSFLAVPFSYIITALLSNIIEHFNIPFHISFDISSMPTIILSLIVVTILSTIPSLFKGKKLSVVEELKYE